MSKSKVSIAAIAVVLLLGIVFFNNRKTITDASMRDSTYSGGMFTAQKQAEEVKEQNSEQDKNENSMINNRGSQKPSATSLSSITKKEINLFRETFPLTIKVREEVAVDPHRTPPSLITFAKNLGPLMAKALNNKDDAGILMNELYDCTIDASVIESARALCVSNAEKLAKVHPHVQDKAEEIRANTSPEVKKLLK